MAESLSATYGMPTVHATKPEAGQAIGMAVLQFNTAILQPIIFDRSHAISRLVYQNDTICDLERELLVICALSLTRRCHLIYCTGRGVRDTDKPHYDDKLIKETADQDKIRSLYECIMKSLPHQKYNFEKDSISGLLL